MSVLIQILSVLGCVGLFLYGMSLMSGGLQKLAGGPMRDFLGATSSNRFKGVLAGFAATAVVQSSMATIMVVVSFVNAGLMALSSAIAVIMGANIGTTISAWIVAVSFDDALSLGIWAVPAVFVSFVLLTCKGAKKKNLGELLMGLSLLLLALVSLKDLIPSLLDRPGAQAFFSQVGDWGIGSVLIFFLAGAAITWLFKSSAATLALTMLLLINAVIPFPLAAAMVLGENVGTALSANLAAEVGNVSAKRAARAHLLFNIVGIVWTFAFFRHFLSFVQGVTSTIGLSEPYNVAIFHTLFNLANTLLLICFLPWIEKAVSYLVVAGKDSENNTSLKFIHSGLMSGSELSLNEAKQEMVNFGEYCYQSFSLVRAAINEQRVGEFEKINARLVKTEEETDLLESEIANYLSELSKGELSELTTEYVKAMYKIIGELESLGDAGESIGRILQRKNSHGKVFDEEMLSRLNRMADLVEVAYQIMVENLRNPHLRDIQSAQEAEAAINACRNDLREEHIVRIENNSYQYATGVYFIDLVSELEQMGDFIINVSEAKLMLSGKNN